VNHAARFWTKFGIGVINLPTANQILLGGLSTGHERKAATNAQHQDFGSHKRSEAHAIALRKMAEHLGFQCCPG
jgi:hypothetical protein